MRDAGNKANISGPIPQIRQFADWLQASRDLKFAEYEDMWRWSVTDIDAFWQSIWDYHRIESPTAFVAVLNEETMPGARSEEHTSELQSLMRISYAVFCLKKKKKKDKKQKNRLAT